MERTEVLDMMSGLKLYGLRSAYDETLATALKRKHELSARRQAYAVCASLTARQSLEGRGLGEAGALDQAPGHGRQAAASCLVPAFDGGSVSSGSQDALRARFEMGAPRRVRRSVERYSIVRRSLRRWPNGSGSIRRPSPSGGSAPRFPISRQAQRSPDKRSCPSTRRPWPSPSEGIRCRRSTTAFTLCSRRSRILMRSSPHRCLKGHGISATASGRTRRFPQA